MFELYCGEAHNLEAWLEVYAMEYLEKEPTEREKANLLRRANVIIDTQKLTVTLFHNQLFLDDDSGVDLIEFLKQNI